LHASSHFPCVGNVDPLDEEDNRGGRALGGPAGAHPAAGGAALQGLLPREAPPHTAHGLLPAEAWLHTERQYHTCTVKSAYKELDNEHMFLITGVPYKHNIE